jgi:hypothetical protein
VPMTILEVPLFQCQMHVIDFHWHSPPWNKFFWVVVTNISGISNLLMQRNKKSQFHIVIHLTHIFKKNSMAMPSRSRALSLVMAFRGFGFMGIYQYWDRHERLSRWFLGFIPVNSKRNWRLYFGI